MPMKKVPSLPPADAILAPSKLFVRSEVLAVVSFLSASAQTAAKQEKFKAVQRLSRIDDRKTVLDILLKELRRSNDPDTLRCIAELLVELGNLKRLQDPLWEIIEDPKTSDDAKDSANLALRHLGDDSDPELYLEYLSDPQALINRETERMLEASAENPEALIDFMDFIFSLPTDEQCHLLQSLQSDFPSGHLLTLYIGALEADPPQKVQEVLVKNLGHILNRDSAQFLADYETRIESYPESLAREEDAALLKTIQKAIKPLRLAGLYRNSEAVDATATDLKNRGLALENETGTVSENDDLLPGLCYATLPDGLGNQGILLSCKRTNGDITVLSVAVNDENGLLGAFGFYALCEEDFDRLCEKFHEEASKIEVPLQYCLEKILGAEAKNKAQRQGIPYEYTCWKNLLAQIKTLLEHHPQTQHIPFIAAEQLAACSQWADSALENDTAQLFQHPDFQTWFLETSDDAMAREVLAPIEVLLTRLMERLEGLKSVPDARVAEGLIGEAGQQMEAFAVQLAERMALPSSGLLALFASRLAEAACLLNTPLTQRFCGLAATEAMVLNRRLTALPLAGGAPESNASTPFLIQLGRRSVEEELFRLGQPLSAEQQEGLTPFVDALQAAWALD